MPPSRNRYALSGETTYGGFATTRSNCSPVDRLEEASGPRLDVVGPVQRCVERRVGERPSVHVGRDHVLRVRGEQDRLDAVAGAEVEGALAAPAHGQVGEGDGRAVHAGDVVGVRLCGARVVGGDQELVVRDEARGPVDGVPVGDEKAGTLEVLPQLVADVAPPHVHA